MEWISKWVQFFIKELKRIFPLASFRTLRSNDMTNPIPKILYKYRNYNNCVLQALKNNQIYFASPSDFNDPFDCLAHEGIVEDFREGMNKIIAENAAGRGLTDEEIKDHLQRISHDEEMIRVRNQADADFQSSLDVIKNEIGIVSLSSCNNSILMWSHYGNFHKGFCIGFKDNLGVPESAVQEVNYLSSIDKSLLLRSFLDGTDEEQFCETLQKVAILSKYRDWGYEKEWRIMGEKGVGTYDDSCIGEIIFGLKMPQENRDMIVTILSGKQISYFEAVKGKSDFSIDIIPVVIAGT